MPRTQRSLRKNPAARHRHKWRLTAKETRRESRGDKQREKAQNNYDRLAKRYAYRTLERSLRRRLKDFQQTHGPEHNGIENAAEMGMLNDGEHHLLKRITRHNTYVLAGYSGIALAKQLLHNKRLANFFEKPCGYLDLVHHVQTLVLESFLESEKEKLQVDQLWEKELHIPTRDRTVYKEGDQAQMNAYLGSRNRRELLAEIVAMVFGGVDAGHPVTGPLRETLNNAAAQVKTMLEKYKLQVKPPSMTDEEWQEFKERSRQSNETETENEQ